MKEVHSGVQSESDAGTHEYLLYVGHNEKKVTDLDMLRGQDIIL